MCVLDPDVDKNLKLVRLCLHLACMTDDVQIYEKIKCVSVIRPILFVRVSLY